MEVFQADILLFLSICYRKSDKWSDTGNVSIHSILQYILQYGPAVLQYTCIAILFLPYCFRSNSLHLLIQDQSMPFVRYNLDLGSSSIKLTLRVEDLSLRKGLKNILSFQCWRVIELVDGSERLKMGCSSSETNKWMTCHTKSNHVVAVACCNNGTRCNRHLTPQRIVLPEPRQGRDNMWGFDSAIQSVKVSDKNLRM